MTYIYLFFYFFWFCMQAVAVIAASSKWIMIIFIASVISCYFQILLFACIIFIFYCVNVLAGYNRWTADTLKKKKINTESNFFLLRFHSQLIIKSTVRGIIWFNMSRKFLISPDSQSSLSIYEYFFFGLFMYLTKLCDLLINKRLRFRYIHISSTVIDIDLNIYRVGKIEIPHFSRKINVYAKINDCLTFINTWIITKLCFVFGISFNSFFFGTIMKLQFISKFPLKRKLWQSMFVGMFKIFAILFYLFLFFVIFF